MHAGAAKGDFTLTAHALTQSCGIHHCLPSFLIHHFLSSHEKPELQHPASSDLLDSSTKWSRVIIVGLYSREIQTPESEPKAWVATQGHCLPGPSQCTGERHIGTTTQRLNASIFCGPRQKRVTELGSLGSTIE
jgi:hypothetical protein